MVVLTISITNVATIFPYIKTTSLPLYMIGVRALTVGSGKEVYTSVLTSKFSFIKRS